MTKHRVRRRRVHPGVKLCTLRDGRHVARWIDPRSGRERQQSMDRLGLTRPQDRRQWAIAKSKDLAAVRAGLAAGGILAAHVKALEGYRQELDRLAAWAAQHGIPLPTPEDP